MNIKSVSMELKIHRILALIFLAVMIFDVIDSVAHGIPLAEAFVNNTAMLVAFGVFFFMYGIQELVNYRNQQKAQDCLPLNESTNGTEADNRQQMSFKNMSTSDKFKFLLGVCCGVATVGILIGLLFILIA